MAKVVSPFIEERMAYLAKGHANINASQQLIQMVIELKELKEC